MTTDASDAIFAQDVETLIEALRSDDPPTEAHKDALARVAVRLVSDIGSIATSMRRIAEAQEQHGAGFNPGQIRI